MRRAERADRPAIVALAGTALGWRADDPNAELFSWKHDQSPFGASPTWIAVCGEQIVGVRVFLRWEFDERGGQVVRAVRAVDTATHPDFQGRGIFRRLTMDAVETLTSEGADFVFNTPNDQSRPGYLKMGWEVLGRVPIGVAVRRPSGLARMLRARVPAGKWSRPTDAGEAATATFGAGATDRDRDALVATLRRSALPADRLLTTRRDAAFYTWRYASGPLSYRVLRRGRHLDDGFAVFRLRARGAATEATICELVHPDADRRVLGSLVRAVLAETGADYAISVPGATVGPGPSLPLPGQGPVFTWRALRRTSVPPIGAWSLRLGDIELF